MAGRASCIGCAAHVPDVDGPTHPYMRSSPGCWRLYGEISVHTNGKPNSTAAQSSPIDCYAAQHPGGAEHDRRQRQSVAVHLTALCLSLEYALPPSRLGTMRGRMSQTVLPRIGRSDWPHLIPPTSPGTVTVADVHHSIGHGSYAAQVERWADAVWTAWSDHHDAVRRWASAALSRSA
ncbi:hypothetical protein K1W54_05415 [Micromonospora sp. CPCC 205371]|nr:hypothetical protein [Micromonospora sp. CPCC 205371]